MKTLIHRRVLVSCHKEVNKTPEIFIHDKRGMSKERLQKRKRSKSHNVVHGKALEGSKGEIEEIYLEYWTV